MLYAAEGTTHYVCCGDASLADHFAARFKLGDLSDATECFDAIAMCLHGKSSAFARARVFVCMCVCVCVDARGADVAVAESRGAGAPADGTV